MTDFVIGSDVNVMDGRSLNLELDRLQNDMGTLLRNNTLNVFTKLEQLGLPETASMKDIAERLPQNSLLMMDIYGGVHGSTMPCPYFSHPNKVYMSGHMRVWRGMDLKKAYFEWSNEHLKAYADYNTYNPTLPTIWRFQAGSYINKNGAGGSYFDSKLSNLWVSGTYYFKGSQMEGFTDAPTHAGSYVTIVNPSSLPSSDRFCTVVENNTSTKQFTRQNSGVWRYVPVMFQTGTSDDQLRVGDMKVASNGRVHMRLSDSIVGQLAYVGGV